MDTPSHRDSIAELTDEQIDALIEGIRHRRMHPIRVFKAAQEDRARLEAARASEALAKKCETFAKALAASDKQLERLHKLALDIRALRLQATGQFEIEESNNGTDQSA